MSTGRRLYCAALRGVLTGAFASTWFALTVAPPLT